MKQKFIEKTFNERDVILIEMCNRILDRYAKQGYDLSLRQIYYQCVSHNVIPNTVRSYQLLGSVINDARMAGLVDWSMITDRGRVTMAPTMWSGPAAMLKRAAEEFALNRWKNQKTYIEVMVEKQALQGVLSPVCMRMGVKFTSNKGYSSASALYETSLRLVRAKKRGKEPVILYLGDHDPSGVDMTRDIRDRLSIFCGWPLDVKRLALNKSQVDEHKLPPNPAKMSDSRSTDYVQKYGRESWELDAIPPRILAGLVQAAISRRIDRAQWDVDTVKEKKYRQELMAIAAVLKKRHKDDEDSSDVKPINPQDVEALKDLRPGDDSKDNDDNEQSPDIQTLE